MAQAPSQPRRRLPGRSRAPPRRCVLRRLSSRAGAARYVAPLRGSPRQSALQAARPSRRTLRLRTRRAQRTCSEQDPPCEHDRGGGEGDGVAGSKAQLSVAGPSLSAAVSPALHRLGELVGPAEGSYGERNEYRQRRPDAPERPALREVGASGGLGTRDLLHLLIEGGDEAERYRHHHRHLMSGEAEPLEGGEQVLYAVGEGERSRSRRENAGSRDEQQYPEREEETHPQATRVNFEKAPIEERAPLSGEKHLEHNGERHYKGYGSEEAQELAWGHAARRHEEGEHCREGEQTDHRINEEKPDDERGCGQDLGARVERVQGRSHGVELSDAPRRCHSYAPSRPFRAASVSSRRTGLPTSGCELRRSEATRTVAGAAAGDA